MANAFLLILKSADSDLAGETKDFLNARAEVVDWIRCYPNMYLVIADSTEPELGVAYGDYAIKNGRLIFDSSDLAEAFVIVGINDSTIWGNLPKLAWDMMRKSGAGDVEVFEELPRLRALPKPAKP